jgi:hypothetical protein
MTKLLEHRNTILKQTAEDGSWKALPGMERITIFDLMDGTRDPKSSN